MTRLVAICVGLVLLFSGAMATIVFSQRRSFPNAEALVFSMGHTDYNLYSVQPNSGFGNNFQTLFAPSSVFDDRYVTGIDCSPDSRSLIFWYIYLYRYDLVSQKLTQIIQGQGLSQSSVWSPDGKEIAYIDNVQDRQPIEILVINADGSNKRQITNNDDQETSLAWSPDSRQIAFTYIHDQTQGLALVDVSSGTTTTLHEAAAHLADVSWSPDGKHLAFDMRLDTNSAIYTIEPDGTNLRRLTNDGENIAPRWSPDGSMISYSSRDATRHYQLYVMGADGSNPYQVFRTTQDDDVFNQCWLKLADSSSATAAS